MSWGFRKQSCRGSLTLNYFVYGKRHLVASTPPPPIDNDDNCCNIIRRLDYYDRVFFFWDWGSRNCLVNQKTKIHTLHNGK